MKKSLAVVAAGAMAFSMLASAAYAADNTTSTELTAQQKFDALKEAGIFDGYPDGTSGLDREMTRAEFSKVLMLIDGLDSNPDGADVYTDVSATHWARGYIGAVTEAGIMNGLGGGKFGPSGNVTIEQLAKVADEIAGLEPSEDAEVSGTVSEWAKGYVAAAIEAGILPEATSYKVNATRAMLVDVAYDLAQAEIGVQVTSAVAVDDLNVEVTFSDGEKVTKKLDTALKPGEATKVSVEYQDKTYEVTVTLGELSIAKAEQSNKGEITVSFNRPLSDNESKDLTYEVKNGLVTYTVTPKWSEDKKSVVLTSTYLPAAEYDVTVKGFDPMKVKVADEIPTKLEIGASSLQKAGNQDLGIKLYNQFGKAIDSPSLTITAFNATSGKTLEVLGTKLDLSDSSTDANNKATKVDDTVVVTATYNATGMAVSKTFKVVAGSAATKITLGTVAPLTGKTRISANETGLVLPYELTDQYGQKFKLGDTHGTLTPDTGNGSFIVDGITFTVNDKSIIDGYAVDSDGVLTLNFKNAGNLIINAINPTTGAFATTSVKVEGGSVPATFQMSNPGVIVVQGEDVTIPYAAVDNFGGAISLKDANLADPDASVTANKDKVLITSTVALEDGYPKINGKGELKLNFKNSGTSYLYAFVNGVKVGELVLDVKASATPIKVNGTTGVQKYLTKGATVDFKKGNVTYLDSYNRTKALGSLPDANVTITGTSVEKVLDGGEVVGLKGIDIGKSTVKVTYPSGDSTVGSYSFDIEVVADSAVASYEIKDIGTMYGGTAKTATDDLSKYNVTVQLIGKLSNGSEVKIVQDNAFDFVTSSVPTVASVSGKTLDGLAAGKTTIAAYKGSTKLDEVEVTVSDVTPYATSVALDKDDYAVTGTATVPVVVTVKDQYGVAFDAGKVSGFLSSSDSKVATVSQTPLSVTGVAQGQATLTYITSSGASDTATVTVD